MILSEKLKTLGYLVNIEEENKNIHGVKVIEGIGVIELVYNADGSFNKNMVTCNHSDIADVTKIYSKSWCDIAKIKEMK